MPPSLRRGSLLLLLGVLSGAAVFLLGPTPQADEFDSPRSSDATAPALAQTLPLPPPRSQEEGASAGAPTSPLPETKVERPPLRPASVTSLGGLEGVVRDTLSRHPLPGAWVSWRLPDTETLLLAFSSRFQQEAFAQPAQGVLTGPEGEFRLERLPDQAPPTATLYAVAPGYACAVVTVGSGRRLEIELALTGELRLEVRPSLDDYAPVPRLLREDPPFPTYQEQLLDKLRPDQERASHSYVYPHLWPGRYSVELEGARAGEVEVAPGRTTHLRLESPPRLELRGVVRGPGGPARGRALILYEASSGRRIDLRTDSEGRYLATVPPGHYVPFALDPSGKSERRVAGELSTTGEHPLQLADPGELVQIELSGDSPTFPSAGRLVLVQTNSPHPDLVFLDVLSPGVYQAQARPGPYAVLLQGSLLAEILLPQPGPLRIELRPAQAKIRWRLPAGLLRDGEALRARVALLPAAIAAHESLLERLGVALWQRVLLPAGERAVPLSFRGVGPHIVHGLCDAGSFSVPLEAPHNGVRSVDLSPLGAARSP